MTSPHWEPNTGSEGNEDNLDFLDGGQGREGRWVCSYPEAKGTKRDSEAEVRTLF